MRVFELEIRNSYNKNIYVEKNKVEQSIEYSYSNVLDWFYEFMWLEYWLE